MWHPGRPLVSEHDEVVAVADGLDVEKHPIEREGDCAHKGKLACRKGRTLSCNAPQSALDALLKRVSAREVEDFECSEAPLEETFLSYYGMDRADGSAAPGPAERAAGAVGHRAG